MTSLKIKVEADLSNVSAEVDNLKTKIDQLGNKLKSDAGKVDLNFSGAKKDLDSLIAQADKLTAALDKGDKKSASYVKNLKAAADAMAQAAKVAAKLENAGTSTNNKTSNYFREYSGELHQESSSLANQNAIEREKEKFRQKLENERHAENTKWAGRAAKFAGFVGGSMLGGGGGYAKLGAGVGSILPGPLGLVGGAIGGAIGGAADRFINPNKAEAKSYSELTRMIGTTTASFEGLRDTVRYSVSSFAIANTEAAELAKNFVKLTSETGSELIGKAIGASVGLAQQYGFSSGRASEFFGTTQLLGASKNSADLQRITVQLAETAKRGGISPKMEEFLSSITGMIQRSASNTLTSQSVGGYADILAGGTSLNYAGLSKSPGGVAELINRASATASAGGAQGEASQEQLTRALFDMAPGISGKWHASIKGFGLFDDLTKGFDKDSSIYGNAKTDEDRQEILGISEQLKGKKLFNAYADRAKVMAHGDYSRELGIFGALTGMNPQQSAALLQIGNSKSGYGGLEKQLDSFGIDKATQSKYAGRYAELSAGGDGAAKKYFEKLKSEKILSKDLVDEGNKLSGKDLEAFIYKKAVPSQLDDPGLQYQKSSLDLENQMSSSLDKLVSIESDAREVLMSIYKAFGGSDFLKERRIAEVKSGVELSGKSAAGGDSENWWDGSNDKSYIDNGLDKILTARSPEARKAAYEELMSNAKKSPVYYPAETAELAMKAYRMGSPDGKLASSPGDESKEQPATIPAGPGYTGGSKQDFINKMRPYADMAGKTLGVSPSVLLAQSGLETGWGGSVNGNNFFNIKADKGWHGKRLKGYRAYDTPKDSFEDYATFIQSNPRYGTALKYAGNSDRYVQELQKAGYAEDRHYAEKIGGIYDSIDQMPDGHIKAQRSSQQDVRVTVNGSFDLNQNGQRIASAAPVFTTSRGRPVQAGVN